MTLIECSKLLSCSQWFGWDIEATSYTHLSRDAHTDTCAHTHTNTNFLCITITDLNQFTGSFSCYLIMIDMAFSNASSCAILWLQSQIDGPLFPSCSCFFFSVIHPICRICHCSLQPRIPHDTKWKKNGPLALFLAPSHSSSLAATYLRFFFFLWKWKRKPINFKARNTGSRCSWSVSKWLNESAPQLSWPQDTISPDCSFTTILTPVLFTPNGFSIVSKR